MVLKSEPFTSFTPNEVRKWLVENPDESSLSLALSAVGWQIDILEYDYDESVDPWVKFSFLEWKDLFDDMCQMVTRYMPAEIKGCRFSMLQIFMERNGYQRSGFYRYGNYRE